MHELSIALNILEIAAEHARREGGVVAAVHLKLGPLSGVARESLASAYALARRNSALKDAELVIEEMPLRIACPRCGVPRVAASPQDIRCGVCGTPAAAILGGRELEVTALEIRE